MNYSLGACQPPSSSSAGAGLAGWPTNWTRADEVNCLEAVRAFGSGNIGDGSELDFVSFAGIGSAACREPACSPSVQTSASATHSSCRPSPAPLPEVDATLHDEHPDGGVHTTAEPHAHPSRTKPTRTATRTNPHAARPARTVTARTTAARTATRDGAIITAGRRRCPVA